VTGPEQATDGAAADKDDAGYIMSTKDFNVLLEASLDLLASQDASPATPVKPTKESQGWGDAPIPVAGPSSPSTSSSSNSSSLPTAREAGSKETASGEDRDVLTELARLGKLVKKSRKNRKTSSQRKKGKMSMDIDDDDSDKESDSASKDSDSNAAGPRENLICKLPPETMARIFKFARIAMEHSDPPAGTQPRKTRASRNNATFGKPADPLSPCGIYAQCEFLSILTRTEKLSIMQPGCSRCSLSVKAGPPSPEP
jgi:hypothetical protein